MKNLLIALWLGVFATGVAADAAEAPKKPVTIESETLNKATAANLQKKGADTVIEATGKANKLGIVIETDGKTRIPPIVLVPADPEWSEVMDLAKKIAADRKAKAEATLKDLGVTVTP